STSVSTNINRGSIWSSTKITPVSKIELSTTTWDSNNEKLEEDEINFKNRVGAYAFCCQNYKVLLAGLLIGLLTAGIALSIYQRALQRALPVQLLLALQQLRLQTLPLLRRRRQQVQLRAQQQLPLQALPPRQLRLPV
ncbi:unnamed protein product, partial [Rotaria sp. Silwood1]